MERNKVLIIEDEESAFRNIKDKIIPQEMFSVFDHDGSAVGGLSEDEKYSITKFHSTESGALRKSMDYIAETINDHYQEIGLIICDLLINGNDNAGSKIIESIRHSQGFRFNKQWYGKEVPILIVSQLVDKDQLKAYEKSSGNCFFLSKTTAFSNEGAAILNTILRGLVEQFNEKFNKYDSKKQYKVALSFTGSNIGEDGKELKIRSFIAAIANILSCYYTSERVFFDMNQQESSNAKNTEQFVETYNDAEYVIVFISEGYKNKKSRWSSAEWEVIKKLDLSKRVIFIAIDSTLKESEFKTELGIDEVIYRDMLGFCSDYNELLNVADSETVAWIKDNVSNLPITELAAHIVNGFNEKSSKIIKEAAGFIIETIKKREART